MRDELERALPALLEALGVRALGRERKVFVNPDYTGYTFSVGLPPMRVDVRLEGDDVNPDNIMSAIERGVKRLFHEVVQHIAKHDRSPIDRVQSLEKYATALLEVLGASLSDIRMPFGVSSKVQNAAHDLATIVKQKPGAATWARNGYGEDPK